MRGLHSLTRFRRVNCAALSLNLDYFFSIVVLKIPLSLSNSAIYMPAGKPDKLSVVWFCKIKQHCPNIENHKFKIPKIVGANFHSPIHRIRKFRNSFHIPKPSLFLRHKKRANENSPLPCII
jgi:hypothetical protein